MNFVLNAQQMRELDRLTTEQFGLSARILMANAGRFVAEYISTNYRNSKCAIVCGAGNNGGDGYACALFLFGMGIRADVYEVRDSALPEDTAYFREQFLRHSSIQSASLFNQTSNYELIVDALTGTGFTGPLRDDLASLVRKINKSAAAVISIDLPSGLPSTEPSNLCVDADVTITLGCHKPVTVTLPGKDFCGEVILADIGFPPVIVQSINADIALVNRTTLLSGIKTSCRKDINKYSNGAVLILAGSEGMEGAAMMTASSLFEAGCGIAVLVTSRSAAKNIRGRIPELIIRDVDSEATADDIGQVLEHYIAKGFTTVLAGPGLGRDKFAQNCMNALVSVSSKKGLCVIVDGDGLFFLSRLDHSFSSLVITPHFGEAAMLLDCESSKLMSNRIDCARALAQRYQCVAHLKGPYPLTASRDFTYVSPSAETRLATAGSGDVLSGVIASFIAKDSFGGITDAVAAAAEVHSYAASFSHARAIRAGDIIRHLRDSISTLTDG